MKRFLLVTAIACCLLAGCAEGWTEEHKRAYLESCGPQPGMTKEQSDRFCQCMLEATMQHYETITEVIANKDSVQMAAARVNCRTKSVQP